jgi:hypothetical protein
MKKMMNLCLCVSLCIFLGACAGPGTGPYGTYTAADRYRDNTNTALAIGATAIGAVVIGSSLYRAGRRDGRRSMYHVRPTARYDVHRRVYWEAPVYRYAPYRRVYWDAPRIRYAPYPRVHRRLYYR